MCAPARSEVIPRWRVGLVSGGHERMNIAVFLPNWIGDAVMATPALRALRQHFAGARLVGVLRPYISGVLEGCPWLDGRLLLDRKGPWSRRGLAVAARLRALRVDLAVL